MKNFNIQAAQGDILIERIKTLPEGVTVVVPTDQRWVIVSHSETGHHHVLDRQKITMYRLPEEIYECFIVVDEATALTHLRPFDTHEPILLDVGTYRVRRQREYVPEGFRRVED